MPTVRENLVTARENYSQQLADLSDPAKRRPSYSIAGRSVQWPAYMTFLRQEIKELDALIAAEDDGDTGGFTVTAIQ